MAGVSIDMDKGSLLKAAGRINNISKQLDTKPGTNLGRFLMRAGENLATHVKKQTPDTMPVVTGRLRASVHSKYRASDSFLYTDKDGKTFNGGLTTSIKEGEEVIVGSNVEYAAKINETKGFMRKAQADFMPIFDRELKKEVERIVRG